MKRCSECGVEKPFSEFHRSKRGKDGHRSKCKECLLPYYQEYFRRPHRIEKGRQSSRDFYASLTADEKRDLMAQIRERREREPTHMLGKSLRRGLQRHPTDNPASTADLIQMWKNQGGRCAVSGIVMTWAKGTYLPTSISIDRKDPKGGYSLDNVRLVCYAINAFRGVWSDDHMIEMARAIVAKADAASREPTWRPHLVPSEAA
jgi:hypothetical protein